MSEERLFSPEMTAALNKIFRDALGRAPRYAYWEHRQRMFCYTTEPDSAGRYASWDYAPYGPGSRTGEAQKWKMVERVDHSLRRKAKARAYARYAKARDADA